MTAKHCLHDFLLLRDVKINLKYMLDYCITAKKIVYVWQTKKYELQKLGSK